MRRFLARAWVNALQRNGAAPRPLAIGMSATLGEPSNVWGALVGRTGMVQPIAPQPLEAETDPQGREYFFFAQPEVESRGQLIAGESTTIQTLMCLAHSMRRRPGDRGGYRGLVFFDSIDSLKRLLDDYRDAEQRKKLARLRTQRYPADPVTQQPRRECCGKPSECDLFKQGECWYFAAGNDPYQVAAHQNGEPVRYQPGQPLAVMDRPVYSGSSERVERMIGENDLIFSTSSLEVGFDDDEMILVYQHYSPVNLASFIQRKGRGGRGIEDRPVTGVTLSIYSPRDAWYFRHPDEMLRADGFEIPLNPDNFFVRRGQALAAVLDALARYCHRAKIAWPNKPKDSDLAVMGRHLAVAATEVDDFLRRSLGPGLYQELRVKDVLGLWNLVCREVKGPAEQATWRKLLPWIPERLFDAINLPLLAVRYPPEGKDPGEKTEDIALLFGQCAPGNATRRFGKRQVHWLPPSSEPFAPMLPTAADYQDAELWPLLSEAQRLQVGNTAEGLDRSLRERLPDEVASRLPAGTPLHHELCRPTNLRLETLGVFDAWGNWTPHWFWDGTNRSLTRSETGAPSADHVPVHHKSRAELLGFPLLNASPGLGRKTPIRGLGRVALDLVRQRTLTQIRQFL